MNPLFEEKKNIAANVIHSGDVSEYTALMFQEDFPQFFKKDGANHYECHVPEGMLNTFIKMANQSVSYSRWGDMWRYACGLYVAHHSTSYLNTYMDGTESPAVVSSNAQQIGLVSSATMGDTSVSYDNSAITSGTEKWGAWNSTKYGAQFSSMARMIGIAGTYAI